MKQSFGTLFLFSLLALAAPLTHAADDAPADLDGDGAGEWVRDESVNTPEWVWQDAPGVTPPSGSGTTAAAGGVGGIATEPICTDVPCCGMPRWHVTEPSVNLWLADTPLLYRASRGRSMRFWLFYKNTLGPQGDTDNSDSALFSVGRRWHTPWRSYLRPIAGEDGAFWVHSGNGSVLKMITNKVDYVTRAMLTVESSTNILELPNGGRLVFGQKTTVGGTTRYFLTRRQDAHGNAINLQYAITNGGFRLEQITDVDNRAVTFEYSSHLGGYSNVITKVSSPHGTNALLSYDSSANLTSIVDSVNLTSRMEYTGTNLTALITPYGTNTFSYFSQSTNMYAIRVAELGVRRFFHLYYAEVDGGKVPYNYTGYVPNTTNSGVYAVANTFDHTNTHRRNTFLWNPRQYDALADLVRTNLDNGSFNVSNLTSTDYLKGRQRHWLKATNGMQTSRTGSMVRDASPDGSLQGQCRWLDYAGKYGGYHDREGTMRRPRITAVKLPNGECSMASLDRNDLGHATNKLDTFTTTSGYCQLRTNQYLFAANKIDLIKHTQIVGATSKVISSNVFNSAHRVLTNFNALGEATVLTWNAKGQLLTIKTPGGLTRSNANETSGTWSNFLSKSIALEIGATNSYSWSNGYVFTKTDPRGLVTTSTRDALGRVTKLLYPDGTGMTNNYDKLDLVSAFDRLGNSNRYVYNGFRKRTQAINPLNGTNAAAYCDCGSLDSMTDPLGNTTAFSYDLQGMRIATTYPGGGHVTNNYNLLKQVTTVIDSAGKGMTNCYNNQGLLCIVSNAFGALKMTVYDDEDQITESVDGNAVTNTFTYDDLGRTTKRTDGNNKIELYGYSSLGMTIHSNQLGNATHYTYDAAGRKAQEINANGETNSFTYNAAGDLTKLIDRKGQQTTWGYDVYGRVTSKTNATGQEIFRYAYDANGRLTNRWSLAKGNTRYVHDAAGNLTLVDYPSSPDITMQYDANNRLTNMVDAAGASRYAYADFGALLAEDGPWVSDTVSYAYTANWMRSKVTLLQPNASDWIQTYAYDNADRLTNVTSPAGAFGYFYDTAQNLMIRKLTQPPGSFITNTYDVLGRVTGTYQKNSGGTLLNAHEYLHDDAHRRTKQTRTGGDFVDYSYDNIGQLKTASGKEAGGTTNRMLEQFCYVYDAAGNLNHRTNDALVQTFNVNNQNEITSVTRSGKQTVSGTTWGPATNVTVADNGNSPIAALRYADFSFARTNVTLLDGTNSLTAVGQDTYGRSDTNTTFNYLPSTLNFAWDGNGNLITNGTRIFTYDDENQLATITEPAAWKSEFTYDGKMRRRIRKEYVWQLAITNWQLALEVRYVYDGKLVLEERHFHPQLSTQIPFNSVSYTRGRDLGGGLDGAGGIGGLLARTDHSTLHSGDPSTSPHAYYHADGKWQSHDVDRDKPKRCCPLCIRPFRQYSLRSWRTRRS